MVKENIILELTLEFSLQIIAYCELLEENRKFVIARQLFIGLSKDLTRELGKGFSRNQRTYMRLLETMRGQCSILEKNLKLFEKNYNFTLSKNIQICKK